MQNQGEKLLLFAVLERAIADAGNCCFDLWKGEPGSRRLAVERAREWILEWQEKDFDIPWTFPWVCTHMELCPYTLKNTLTNFGWQPLSKSGMCGDRIIRQFLDRTPTVDDEHLYHHG